MGGITLQYRRQKKLESVFESETWRKGNERPDDKIEMLRGAPLDILINNLYLLRSDDLILSNNFTKDFRHSKNKLTNIGNGL